ncbi:hypothetical protein LCGC14_1453490 [marine sediment metagenome]|uniref:Phage capsid-like C-terminal domain-containing protein n=1 Tax=marine sediment metagenome TaxID=412755 RepID=A0A0F9JHV2_9ZZZZ
MDEKEIAELAARVATEAVEKLSKVEKKPIPVDDEVIVGKGPEEKLLEDKKSGFKSMGHFFTDLIRCEGADGETSEVLKNYSNALKKTAGFMEEGDLSQGGYLVPEEFRGTLLQTALEASIVKQRATVIPMASNRVTIPALVDDDHTSDYFGGVVIYRTAEKGSKTPKNPVFGKVGLTLHKLTGLCYVTDELLQDSAISIEPIIRNTFGQAVAFVQDYDFLRGNGANQALGVFHASNPSIISVAKETGQDADTIVFENIIKMWSRLYPAGQAKAIWVANINTFPQLATMNMSVGSGGVPVYLPAGGVSGAPFATLMGRPLIFTEKMATVGDLYDIGLADFSQYIIGEKGGLNFATSMHVRFVTDEMAFRFVMRYDGQPWWLATLTPKAGSTLSPFITLAERT